MEPWPAGCCADHARGVLRTGGGCRPLQVLHGSDELHRRQVDSGRGASIGEPGGRAPHNRFCSGAGPERDGRRPDRQCPRGNGSRRSPNQISRRNGQIPEGRLETGLANALHAQWRTSERSFFCGMRELGQVGEEIGADRDGHERKVCHSPGRSQLRGEIRLDSKRGCAPVRLHATHARSRKRFHLHSGLPGWKVRDSRAGAEIRLQLAARLSAQASACPSKGEPDRMCRPF